MSLSLQDPEVEVLERHEISDDEEDDFDYVAVDVESEVEVNEADDDDEDLATALASLTAGAPATPGGGAALRAGRDSKAPRSITNVKPTVVDDFIRNFLIKTGLRRTLDEFNTEWYELQSTGKLSEEYTNVVPDIYERNMELDEQCVVLRKELERMKAITEKAQGTWDRFRKERDFHRMHHQRVVQEKNRLVTDLKRLKKHYKSYEPLLKELRHKYETAMKEKMLVKLERDRMKARVGVLETQLASLQEQQQPQPEPAQTEKPRRKKRGPAVLPPDDSLVNPYLGLEFTAPLVESFSMQKTFKGHLNAISSLAFHPKKPILCTTSDDMTWKIWSVPNCELIMSGEGHMDWLGGADFSPDGSGLATGSGDNTVKIWNFATASCSATLSDHTQPVWDVAYHCTGDFLASCSMDHTTRLWDTTVMRCRQTFRGHVDSVNAVTWQPFSNNICTCSGDKTVSLWDARSGLCVQTFYGHLNACNHVAVTHRGDMIGSCDADGVVKLWDVRMVMEIATLEGGQHPLNKLAFDRSGSRIAAASDDGNVKLFSVLGRETAEDEPTMGTEAQNEQGAQTGAFLAELRGHEDAVQAVIFDPTDRNLISAASDCTFRIWG
uniref:Uncharacterized protein n=1 Tax=Phaeomonas parva TaxID=124430 RepID=A0A6U4DU09_9STRA|mmetsp:Transcript_18281/g.55848  ORF Transcript_18281/g.55848 Transcript_18281/m.55848 type:complete len:608 (+) Transcript_18281:319-2142(+)